MLPNNPKERKTYPIASGFLDYFPRAVAAVAHLSYVGNEQHNPGQPLHWDRSKSTDEDDALMRHFLRRNEVDGDGIPERVKVAWRAMAGLEKYLEQYQERDTGAALDQWRETMAGYSKLAEMMEHPQVDYLQCFGPNPIGQEDEE